MWTKDSFGSPTCEVSWDGGKTWGPYQNAVGENMLARIVDPDGWVLWTGQAEYHEQKCGGCDGTGKSRWLHFKTHPDSAPYKEKA